jgi:hypothetical protein
MVFKGFLLTLAFEPTPAVAHCAVEGENRAEAECERNKECSKPKQHQCSIFKTST